MDSTRGFVIDAHTHLMQDVHPRDDLPVAADEVGDIERLLAGMDEAGLSHAVTLSQEMARVRGQWLGSIELSVDLQARSGGRLLGLAGFEPMTLENRFNDRRFAQVRELIQVGAISGLLVTPPYGHFAMDDRRAYPFYQLAAEADLPIFVHLVHHAEDPGKENSASAGGSGGHATRLGGLEQVAADFPALHLNVEHMADPWSEDLLAIMVHCPNVWTDITKVTNKAGLPGYLQIARDHDFLDRVFCGTDYVGTDVDEYLSLVRSGVEWVRNEVNELMRGADYLPLAEAEIDGLLHVNVRRFLDLPTPSHGA